MTELDDEAKPDTPVFQFLIGKIMTVFPSAIDSIGTPVSIPHR